MTPDHVCIKCSPTDPEPEMVALCKQGEDGYVSAWVHPRCLFQYRGPASIFEFELHRASTGGESEERNVTVLDTTPVTREITKLIATGTTEQAILSAVAYLLPAISPAELSAVLQEARLQLRSGLRGGIDERPGTHR